MSKLLLYEVNCQECKRSIGFSEQKGIQGILCDRCADCLSMVQEITGAKVIMFPDNPDELYKPRPINFHSEKSKSLTWWMNIHREFFNWLSNGRKVS